VTGVARVPARAARTGARGIGSIVLLAICLAGCGPNPDAADLAIWRIVDHGCNATPATASGAQPQPARSSTSGLQCDSAQGYAVLKDRCGKTHFLLIPTARRVGVESPELLSEQEPNYFERAWNERGRSLAALPAPRHEDADIGLAINSRYGRSQAQLHIHIDFVQPEVRAALRGVSVAQGAAGTRLELMGHWYRVDHVDSLAQSPFTRVAGEWGARTEMDRARLTLAVVGDGGRGFFLLSDRADLLSLDRGHAEELLVPHSCG
jgi:CDP-diacylglycerol pyrophosphatase